MVNINHLSENIKKMGTIYVLLFLAIFYIVFLDPSFIINKFNINPTKYHEVIHLPENSIADTFWNSYKGINENQFIKSSTLLGALFLTVISASNSLASFFEPGIYNKIKAISIVITSFVICYAVSSLASISLFSTNDKLSNSALSIISVFGVLSLVTVAMAMDNTVNRH